mmetsp:Transcript_112270/g.317586  ORF Transcript_112270/g.317586 Transcript_112270/m.317586 type:complete len:216 (+) Transcript_112270:483-1130(+)
MTFSFCSDLRWRTQRRTPSQSKSLLPSFLLRTFFAKVAPTLAKLTTTCLKSYFLPSGSTDETLTSAPLFDFLPAGSSSAAGAFLFQPASSAAGPFFFQPASFSFQAASSPEAFCCTGPRPEPPAFRCTAPLAAPLPLPLDQELGVSSGSSSSSSSAPGPPAMPKERRKLRLAPDGLSESSGSLLSLACVALRGINRGDCTAMSVSTSTPMEPREP